ncbi:MAG TPA: iron-sulfur cluster biosynthesis family protein [Vicinamibacterales bacterium]|nr:iron-sulfur cluster biosynthesis family protein [Vicinamibacterales bacterium]
MTLTFSPEAREAVRAWLARDPAKPALRLFFAGGCGALGYQLTPAEEEPRAGEQVVEADGITVYADFKSVADLDGARIEVGESPDDIVVVHEQCVVGGMC